MKICNQYCIKFITSFLTIVGLILFIPPIKDWLWLHRDWLHGFGYLLLALGLFNLSLIKNKLNQWIKLLKFGWIDSFVIALPFSIIFYFLVYHYCFNYWLLLFLLPWACLFWRKNLSLKPKKQEEETHPYFELLGNISPIKLIQEDELERKEFAERIGKLLKGTPANKVLVCGIQGSWGSGKTSLMNMVFEWMGKQENYLFECITFESWHYREPDRIISVFFKTIEQVLNKHCTSYPQIKSLLSEIANFVSNVSLGGINFNLEKYSTDWEKDSRKKLQGILKDEFHLPLFIFVDDLDRLEKEELHAVLRSVRLLIELSNIHFILAYDKSLLSDLLFPEDKSGELAADYLGKIIQLEFNLAVPRQDIREKMLYKVMDRAQRYLSQSEIDKVRCFIAESGLSYQIFSLLQTPREIRKIFAATIWIYLCHPNVYDLVDLFILTIIQYRIPKLYRKLQIESELIIEGLCNYFKLPPRNHGCYSAILQFQGDGRSQDPLAVEGELTIKGQPYSFQLQPKNEMPSSKLPEEDKVRKQLTVKLLSDLTDDSIASAESCLQYILTPFFNSNSSPTFDDSFKNRRLCNPEYYQLYFQYVYSDQLKEVDKFRSTILSKDIDFDQRFREKDWCVLLDVNKYWEIFKDSMLRGEKNVIAATAEKIVLALAKNSDIFSPSTKIDRGARIGFALRAYILIHDVIKENKNLDQLVNLVCKAIDVSSSYGFAAYLSKATCDPDNFHLQRRLNFVAEQKRKIEKEIQKKCKEYFIKKYIFELDFDDFVGLIAWTAMNDDIRSKIYNDLESEPEKVFKILDIYLQVSNRGEILFADPSDSLSRLNNQLSCKILYEKVKGKIDIPLLSDPQKKQYEYLDAYVKKQSFKLI